MDAKPTIRIMAEFGNGAWAWEGTSRAGPFKFIADASYGPVGYSISEDLKRDFAEWAIEYDRNGFEPRESGSQELELVRVIYGLTEEEVAERVAAEKANAGPPFDWLSFNERGLALAKRLYAELGGRVDVFYEKPAEDPNHKVNERTFLC
jgi:hypothetical protein